MITGGGTGGHTSPAVAIIEELQKRDPRLLIQWVGCAGSIEERVSTRLAIPFRSISVKGWPRKNLVRQLVAGLALGVGAIRATFLLLKFRPQLILGVGGYVSVPLTWVGQRLGIATILHEQNKSLGMANRLLAKSAARLLLSHADTTGDYPTDRARVVGNPVRVGFASPPTREDACLSLKLDPAIPTVLLCGGSQGARRLNEALEEGLAEFEPNEIQILWMTGAAGAAAARGAAAKSSIDVQVFAYIDDMVTACAAATLIVGRAGASTTAEIAMVGRPSILVPYPYATDNHQEINALAFKEAGAAVLLTDAECTPERLICVIRELVADPAGLADMARAARDLARPVAVEAIVEEIFSLVFDSNT